MVGGKVLALAMCLIVTLMSNGALGEEELGNPRSSYGLGSAKYLEGTNVLYSLFVDTPDAVWQQADKEAALEKLQIATEYIEEAAGEYGVDAELICDWQENVDLSGQTAVDFPIRDGEDFEDRLDEEIAYWVENTVDYEVLKETHGAEGAALLVFVNNPSVSYAIVFDGTDNPKESVIMFSKEAPAVYAHEIMHLFGAHDLYEEAEFTSEVCAYVRETYPLEIMYRVTDVQGKSYDDEIVNTLSPITAYHLGWVDEIEEIILFPQLVRKK
ncbi:MAG: hypothetical protein IJ409_02285 [Lachnospiraceae bacterium]|nr:hypothetical protein [Lachnospiraceae bacterium]